MSAQLAAATVAFSMVICLHDGDMADEHTSSCICHILLYIYAAVKLNNYCENGLKTIAIIIIHMQTYYYNNILYGAQRLMIAWLAPIIIVMLNVYRRSQLQTAIT